MEVEELLAGGGVVALTGAGMSTDSGIPDYRGPGTPRRTPMTYQDFTRSERGRQRYWGRSHVGWQRMAVAAPNDGHRALAALGRAGLVGAVITQNVDGLHDAAGSAGCGGPARQAVAGGVPGLRRADPADEAARAAGDAQPRLGGA